MSFHPGERPTTLQLHEIAKHEIKTQTHVKSYSTYPRDMIEKNVELWDEIERGRHGIGLETIYKEDKRTVVILLIGYEHIKFYSRAIPSESRS